MAFRNSDTQGLLSLVKKYIALFLIVTIFIDNVTKREISLVVKCNQYYNNLVREGSIKKRAFYPQKGDKGLTSHPLLTLIHYGKINNNNTKVLFLSSLDNPAPPIALIHLYICIFGLFLAIFFATVIYELNAT